MKLGQIATLLLSGEKIKVGVDSREFPWFQTEENSDPIYMSVAEMKLFIVALEASIAEVQDHGS